MITTLFLSQTPAAAPNCFLKMPIVAGPHTSWVMSTSTSTQTFSLGATVCRPAWRARIFSVSVMGAIATAPANECAEGEYYIRSGQEALRWNRGENRLSFVVGSTAWDLKLCHSVS